MRIGFDVTPITAARTGVGNYCYQLLSALLAVNSGHIFAGFSSGRARIDLGDLARHVPHRHFPLPTRALYALWSTAGLPKADSFLGGVDVFHATNFFLPPTRTAKRAVTIHDLTFLLRPELCSPAIVGPFSRGIRRFARAADAILAYSESTKQDIVRLLDVDPAKITVAPIAANPELAPVPQAIARERIETRYGIAAPDFLFVGALEPRKNIGGIVRAYSLAARHLPHRLVLAGPLGWKTAEILSAIEGSGVAERIIRPGFVAKEDLSALYSAADAFVFPSWYEGFGLPLLEAMVCGCPVITSNNSSILEVAGDAAIALDANDTEGIAAGLRALVEDAELRQGLVARGLAQAKRFSWDACARATLHVYERLHQDR